jgi:hypothetical protein
MNKLLLFLIWTGLFLSVGKEVRALPPEGNFEEIVNGATIKGWAVDPDSKQETIKIRVYADGSGNDGPMIGEIETQVLRTDVNAYYGGGTVTHGFSFSIPAEYREGFHIFYVYGVDKQDGSLKLIAQSPKSIGTVPVMILDSEKYYGTNVDSAYGYAPSIIKKDGKYHAYFCSSGGGGVWDYIRYSSSTDGINWTNPVIALAHKIATVDGKVRNMATCDPSVIYENGYYYLFIGTADQIGASWDRFIGYINVARSTRPDGGFAFLNEANGWEVEAARAKRVAIPIEMREGWYGVGQPSVLKKDGLFYMWYTDNTDTTNTSPNLVELFLQKTSDITNWPTRGTKIIVPNNPHPGLVSSIDVKYDALLGKFVMFWAYDRGHRMYMSSSLDGIHWEELRAVSGYGFIPYDANNGGLSGDEKGHILTDEKILFGFGANPKYRVNRRVGFWDVRGIWVNRSDYVAALRTNPTITPTRTPTPTLRPPTLTPTRTPTLTLRPPTATVTSTPTRTPSIIVINPTITPTPTVASKCSLCASLPNGKSSGDANCSGTTTISDAEIWREEYVESQGEKLIKNNWRADFNCDGVVGLDDAEVWREKYIELNRGG